MRLTAEQRSAIVEETTRAFGPTARVCLFGSRVDDARRGGDIDLHIEAEGSAAELLDRELALYAQLIRRLGEQGLLRPGLTPVLVNLWRSASRSADARLMQLWRKREIPAAPRATHGLTESLVIPSNRVKLL